MAYEKLDPDLKTAVGDFNDAYAKGNPKWFTHFAEDATVYSDDAAEPHQGRSAYQKYFEPKLAAEKRQVQVLKQDAQMMGDTAVVMQLLEVTGPQLAVNVRESTIWRRTDKGWKVGHLNASIVGPSRAIDAPRTADAVRVLSEKLAIVSSQAGVAQ
jgi:ketosteroid isomerase-like protein